MTRVATAGTSSCATISIAGFKGGKKDNEVYRKTGNAPMGSGTSVEDFYNNVLYPVSQPLGHSREYVFDQLMDEIDSGHMKGKFILATLNLQQKNYSNGYWHKRLIDRGFTIIDATNNIIGEKCFIYSRNLNRVDIDCEEEEEDDLDEL